MTAEEQKAVYYTRAQKCPTCAADVPLAAPRCWLCGHQFLSNEQLSAEALERQKQFGSPPVGAGKRTLAHTVALIVLTMFLAIIAFGVAAEARINGIIVLVAFLVPMSFLWGGADAASSTFSRILRGLMITIGILISLFVAALIALWIMCTIQ